MRITKSYLRETRTELEQSVRSAFSYTDDDLRDRLKAMWPLLVAGTREENLRMLILLTIRELIPDHMIL